MYQQKRVMLTNPERDRNIEELNDEEICAAIRYLEPDSRSAGTQKNDTVPTKEIDDNSVVICACLYVAVLGFIAILWLYLR